LRRQMGLRSWRPLVLLLVAAALGLAISCRVTFTDELRYSCASTADCGGDTFVCTAGVCCKPTGTEVCDTVDNDCDGQVDNTGQREVCNELDDDCDGQVDEGFDLRADVANCGACGQVCAANEYCFDRCLQRVEAQCFDGVDDDLNGKTDCEDPACDGRNCGAACVCDQLRRAEDLCSDGSDNDDDVLVDCADPDCVGKACAAGCACTADAGLSEIDCTDGTDNDLDNKVDCLDPDCVGRFCTPPQIFFSCTAQQACKCNGGVQIAEVGPTLCADAVDNDCNGITDCGEVTCDGQPCSADGGVGCSCAQRAKKETDCGNLADDDGDGQVDCADSDCGVGVSCTKTGGGSGSCTASKTCE
jgi:hypothetical protein